MQDIGFAVVGLGMGMARAQQAHDTPGARLVAVCDMDEERLKKGTEEHACKGYADFDQMLGDDEIDAVFVLTPSGTHLTFAERAAAAGKHVITTKPMDVTVERCERIIDACRKAGVKLVVDFETRWVKAFQQLKAALDAGELGQILTIEARCKWYRDQAYYDAGGWRGTWKFDGGGSAANQGIHMLDLLVWLAGQPKVVCARAAALNHDIETEDLAMAILELPNGNPGALITTTNHHLNDEFRVIVTGTSGSANLYNMDGYKVDFKFEDEREKLTTPQPDWPCNAIDDMVRAIRSDAAPLVCGEEGINSIRLLEAVYKKAGLR
jgi:UDP-N-acetyl-2-amino-2-deoxyglucuronate dehydrogenase